MPKNEDPCTHAKRGGSVGTGLLIAGVLVIGVPLVILLFALAIPSWAGLIFVGIWVYGGGLIVSLIAGSVLIIVAIVLKSRQHYACADLK